MTREVPTEHATETPAEMRDRLARYLFGRGIWVTREGTHYQVYRRCGTYLADNGLWSAFLGGSKLFVSYGEALVAARAAANIRKEG